MKLQRKLRHLLRELSCSTSVSLVPALLAPTASQPYAIADFFSPDAAPFVIDYIKKLI